MTVGESIRIVRTKAGLKQGDLADKAEVSQSLISLIENGRREPTVQLVARLCEAMEVPPQLVFLMACEPPEGEERYRAVFEKLSLLMLELLRDIRPA